MNLRLKKQNKKITSSLKFSNHLHCDYYRRTDIVDAVFKEFLKQIYRGFYAKMSKKYGATPSTLKRWYKKFKSNPSGRVYNPANHGMHNRYFTDEEEHSIAEFIRETLIKGLLFTNADFRALAMQAFFENGMIAHPNEIHSTA